MTTTQELREHAEDMRCLLNLAQYAKTNDKAAAELEALQKENARLVDEGCQREIAFDSLRARVAELEKDKERFLTAFEHRHKNNMTDDRCAICGLDLRDEIHIRSASMSAEKK